MLEWLEAHQLPCLFREFFGIICPGCGCQTAACHLLRGNWEASFMVWPGLLPLIVFMALIMSRIIGMKKISVGMLKSVGFVCLIIILISYLLKLIGKQ